MLKASLNLLAYGVSFQDTDFAKNMGFEGMDMQTQRLPARLRRRTSVATKLAFAAAERACEQAGIEPAELTSIFTSCLGEATVTDRLCQDIAAQRFPLSPTQFHNSVHNTASGYWSIAVNNQRPAMAMGGYQDSFALGLLEAWSQLSTVEDKVLLVCYEEAPSERLLPHHHWKPCATALILERYDGEGSGIQLTVPYYEEGLPQALQDDKAQSPVQLSVTLLRALKQGRCGVHTISTTENGAWYVDVQQNG